jgi:hypothetical protein
MVTVNEVIDVMKESPLWETLSLEEQIEVINYAFEIVGLKTESKEEIAGTFRLEMLEV